MVSAESLQAGRPLLSYRGDQTAVLDGIPGAVPLLLGMSHLWGHCSTVCDFRVGLSCIWRRNSISVTGMVCALQVYQGTWAVCRLRGAGLTLPQTSSALLVSLNQASSEQHLMLGTYQVAGNLPASSTQIFTQLCKSSGTFGPMHVRSPLSEVSQLPSSVR